MNKELINYNFREDKNQQVFGELRKVLE